MKRELIETLERRKEMMIAALWANSGFEGQEGANKRRQIIEDLEENYDIAVEKIQTGVVEREEEIDKENPFFESMERGLKKIQTPRNDEGSVAMALKSEGQYEHLEIDQ